MAIFKSISRSVANIGRRFNLPELGISERIYSPVRSPVPASAPRAVSTSGPPRQAFTSPQRYPLTTRAISGPIATTPPVPYNPQVLGTTNIPSGGGTTRGGGVGGGIGRGEQTTTVSAVGQDLSNLTQPEPEAPSIDFDALIGPALQEFDTQIASLESGFPQEEAQIRQTYKTKGEKAQQEITGQEQLLTRQKGENIRRSESAADEARRAYAEIAQGIQGRYGGTTGTGAFAEAVAGREFFRQLGEVKNRITDVVSGIDDKLFQVKEIGRVALQELDDKMNQEILQSKQNLQSELNQIRGQKGLLQSKKVEYAQKAMQFYQDSLNTVRANNAKFKQDLFLKQQDAENKLQLARERGRSVSESYDVFNLTQNKLTTPVRVGKKTGAIAPIGQSYLPSGVNLEEPFELGRVGTLDNETDRLLRELEELNLGGG